MKTTRIENSADRIHRSCRSVFSATTSTTSCHKDRSAMPDTMGFDLPIFKVFDMRVYVHVLPRRRKVSGQADKEGNPAVLF
jgi:hypothetical protein